MPNSMASYDKIASIGMYEHIGLANIPLYLSKVRSLLADNGLFLNHAIARRAKRRQCRLGSRPEQRAILRYIFPGGDLDDIGHTVREMEIHGLRGARRRKLAAALRADHAPLVRAADRAPRSRPKRSSGLSLCASGSLILPASRSPSRVGHSASTRP